MAGVGTQNVRERGGSASNPQRQVGAHSPGAVWDQWVESYQRETSGRGCFRLSPPSRALAEGSTELGWGKGWGSWGNGGG